MSFTYKDCIQKGLLRRIPPSKEKAVQSLKRAREWLRDAENALAAGAINSAIVAAYMVMFHAARSLLFRDGYREKSHACVARYLEEKYVKSGKLDKKYVALLDYSREMRHEDQYDLSFCSTKEDADKAIKSAAVFFTAIDDLYR